MVTCRPDISFPLIKLSQYSAHPARLHFEALQGIYNYLSHTIDDGIYYWRAQPRMDLPMGNIHVCKDTNNYVANTREQTDPTNVRSTVDSDYAGDTSHRKSVTGISIMMAGGCIYYKTRFQATISLSTTEAEFIAACEIAKVILYIRSILDDIGVPQDKATTIYEDNEGA